MQNQDPTEPMDPTTMANQMYAMNGLEQQLETNKLLNKILGSYQDQIVSSVAGNIGKMAVYNGNEAQLVDGNANFNYSVDKKYETVELRIKDHTGNEVYKGEVSTIVGDNQFAWDGKNKFGKTVDDGYYKFIVEGISSMNERTPLKTHSTGMIEAVVSKGNEFKYVVNGQEIVPERVLKYQMAPKDSNSGAAVAMNNVPGSEDIAEQMKQAANDIMDSMKDNIPS